MNERVAAVDCGTNSVRMLVAEASGAGGFTELDRQLRLTRLGQGVDATGEFHPDALRRTFAACDDYADVLGRLGVRRVRFVATSAARDAANREEFFAGVRSRLGLDAEVIDGDEEARLSFAGALSAVPDAEVPALVMDIGGGSTELVLGRPGSLRGAVSLDMGSVRLRERFLAGDPPRPGEIEEATEFVDDLLDAGAPDIAAARTWIGVGGTATSLAAIVLGLASYDRARVHRTVLRRADLVALASRLLSLPVADVLAIPTMEPGRADVLCAGALICARVAARASVDLTVSESDILDGLVAGLLDAAVPATS